ncbi:helix-turn-helix transcriptional regulator [Streptomyces sp. NBC_01549]|uniref:helix-turn-helix domain-containing protein n=1 Tax=Streptomyces sp. NBC_01549 TaxID=2975874 RepID=UPI002251763B|nr:helix-turn-helix transcriptional regulator [Streptomyces sp. NBC_01549]MCX4596147.1 helix-turn-helix transcriptional regulator [Streptomyces sp. NBC_01549]
MKALTARQRQVMVLVANGNTNAAIGSQLGITRVTVDRHLADAYSALGARDRANAVGLAIRYGEIDADSDIRVPGVPQAPEGRQEAPGGPQGAREAANGARDVRGTPGAAERRTGLRGEAAA